MPARPRAARERAVFGASSGRPSAPPAQSRRRCGPICSLPSRASRERQNMSDPERRPVGRGHIHRASECRTRSGREISSDKDVPNRFHGSPTFDFACRRMKSRAKSRIAVLFSPTRSAWASSRRGSALRGGPGAPSNGRRAVTRGAVDEDRIDTGSWVAAKNSPQRCPMGSCSRADATNRIPESRAACDCGPSLNSASSRVHDPVEALGGQGLDLVRGRLPPDRDAIADSMKPVDGSTPADIRAAAARTAADRVVGDLAIFSRISTPFQVIVSPGGSPAGVNRYPVPASVGGEALVADDALAARARPFRVQRFPQERAVRRPGRSARADPSWSRCRRVCRVP